MKRIKEKRGITLIALAVTIIVILILAGVTIDAVIRNMEKLSLICYAKYRTFQIKLKCSFYMLFQIIYVFEINQASNEYKKTSKL